MSRDYAHGRKALTQDFQNRHDSGSYDPTILAANSNGILKLTPLSAASERLFQLSEMTDEYLNSYQKVVFQQISFAMHKKKSCTCA
jgi:hypothetical protein